VAQEGKIGYALGKRSGKSQASEMIRTRKPIGSRYLSARILNGKKKKERRVEDGHLHRKDEQEGRKGWPFKSSEHKYKQGHREAGKRGREARKAPRLARILETKTRKNSSVEKEAQHFQKPLGSQIKTVIKSQKGKKRREDTIRERERKTEKKRGERYRIIL